MKYVVSAMQIVVDITSVSITYLEKLFSIFLFTYKRLASDMTQKKQKDLTFVNGLKDQQTSVLMQEQVKEN